MGPILIVSTLPILLRRNTYLQIANSFTENFAAIYLAGLLSFLTGLLILAFHNIWIFDWPVIITLFGWLALIGGFFRIMFPDLVPKVRTAIGDNYIILIIIAVFVFALGCFLTAMGFRLLS